MQHGALIDLGQALVAFRRGSARYDVDWALDLLPLAAGRLPMPEVARIVATSERSLRRRIEKSVGLSFWALASVLRFQRTLRLLSSAGGEALSLTQAALEGGYADQAHMTREFRSYGGFTPARRPALTLGTMPLSGLAETFKIEERSPAR